MSQWTNTTRIIKDDNGNASLVYDQQMLAEISSLRRLASDLLARATVLEDMLISTSNDLAIHRQALNEVREEIVRAKEKEAQTELPLE